MSNTDWHTDDKILRAALKAWLSPELRIIDELGVGDGRVDVATVASELCGYEIKSCRDNLSRLNYQAVVYGTVFDRLTLVTTMRHIDRAEEILPPYWGIVLAFPATVNGQEIKLSTVRESTPNPDQHGRGLLRLIWRDELKSFLQERGAVRGCSTADSMRARIIETVEMPMIRRFCCDTLRTRRDWR